jgi:hypothetical protein
MSAAKLPNQSMPALPGVAGRSRSGVAGVLRSACSCRQGEIRDGPYSLPRPARIMIVTRPLILIERSNHPK